jgi:cell division protein FtsL
MTKVKSAQKSVLLSKINKILLFSVIVTAAAHFLIVNDLSTQGFVFTDLKSKAKQLVADRQNMESSISALGSYQSINPRIEALHLVAADTIHYISWDKYMVARK